MKILDDSYLHNTIDLSPLDNYSKRFTLISRANDKLYTLLYRTIDKHIDEIDGYHGDYIGRAHPKHIALDSEVCI